MLCQEKANQVLEPLVEACCHVKVGEMGSVLSDKKGSPYTSLRSEATKVAPIAFKTLDGALEAERPFPSAPLETFESTKSQNFNDLRSRAVDKQTFDRLELKDIDVQRCLELAAIKKKSHQRQLQHHS